MKKYFVTFGTGIYLQSKERLLEEAKNLNFFDYVFGFDNSIFDKDFNKILDKNSRGYGFWLWKPYIILKVLNLMDNDDILLYCDSGCKLFPEGLQRLQEYFNILSSNKHSTLSFQLNYIEKDWTKRDLLDLFPEMENTKQLMATAFLVKKNDASTFLINEWLKLGVSNNQHFINDTPSSIQNYPSFKDHRHDQSIFSLLRKTFGTIILDDEIDETTYLFPIRALRIKFNIVILKELLTEDLLNYTDTIDLIALKTNKLIILCELKNFKIKINLPKNVKIEYFIDINETYSNYKNTPILSIEQFTQPKKNVKFNDIVQNVKIDTSFQEILIWINNNKSKYLCNKVKIPKAFSDNIKFVYNWNDRKKDLDTKKIIYIEEQFENNLAIIIYGNNKNYYGKINELNITTEDIIQGKKFRDYFNLIRFRYNNILFCKTDFIKLLECPLINNATVVSSSSDYTITDDLIKNINFNKWYGVNNTSSNGIQLPLGITSYDTKQTGHFIGFSNDTTEIHKILGDTEILIKIRNSFKKYKNLVYLNFDVNTDTERNLIKNLFNNKTWVTHGKLDKTFKGRVNFLTECKDHYYVVCPRGNGIDTHRIWETLYVGSIPIVKLEKGLEQFTDLPILFINDWNEVTEDLLKEKIDFFYKKEWNLEKLFFNYWKKRIIFGM
jgi:hypothetical protein